MGNERILLGRWGEEEAKEYLLNKGYILLEKNWRIKYGEIDLIMQKKETIVFVEVRTKKVFQFGYSFDSLTHKKLNQLRRIASFYIQQKNWWNKAIQFDLIALDQIGDSNKFEIRHIENILS